MYMEESHLEIAYEKLLPLIQFYSKMFLHLMRIVQNCINRYQSILKYLYIGYMYFAPSKSLKIVSLRLIFSSIPDNCPT